jgi:hypothetical protein
MINIESLITKSAKMTLNNHIMRGGGAECNCKAFLCKLFPLFASLRFSFLLFPVSPLVRSSLFQNNSYIVHIRGQFVYWDVFNQG